MTIKNEGELEDLVIKSAWQNKIFNITENNEIIFEDDAVIRIKGSPIAYKTRDIFEVIAFLKFMIKVCGQKMEKCDFNTMSKSRINNDKITLLNFLKGQYKQASEQFEAIVKSINTYNISETNDNITNIAPNTAPKKQIENSKLLKNNKLKSKFGVETVPKNKPKQKTDYQFKFKEENNTKAVSSYEQLFEVDKEIQSEIDLQFNSFKENEKYYNHFINSPIFQYYEDNYYYGGT